ncbi:MAG: lipolytic protein family [Marmoricola sp.]|nr:lipolytic protein family [Marmoricola sp.]
MLVAALLAISPDTGASAAPRHPGPPAHADDGWVASWTASPVVGSTEFNDQTVRNIIYSSVSGNEVRVRLSNTFGSQPVEVGATSVGIVLDGAQLAPGTSHPITFDGHASVTIPVGEEVLSDPINMQVPRLTKLAVDLYLSGPTGPATHHPLAWETNYVASGNHAGDATSTAYTAQTSSWYFVDGLNVHNRATDGTVVAFGDSITDVGHSEVDSEARWPDYLSRRLDSTRGNEAPAVVNAGISGNRVLNDSGGSGESALHRFQRDALSQPGVTAVVLLEGINDIGQSGTDPVTATEMEAGYRQLIQMAHARGVKIYGGTLTPFLGSNCRYGGNYGTPEGEALRQRVNDWIRTSHAFDGVVDFDQAMASPYNSGYFAAAYNSTGAPQCQTADSLHPNDLGDEVMADTVPLSWFHLVDRP